MESVENRARAGRHFEPTSGQTNTFAKVAKVVSDTFTTEKTKHLQSKIILLTTSSKAPKESSNVKTQPLKKEKDVGHEIKNLKSKSDVIEEEKEEEEDMSNVVAKEETFGPHPLPAPLATGASSLDLALAHASPELLAILQVSPLTSTSYNETLCIVS